MGLNYEGLKAEAERAFKGTQDSEEQKAESIKKSFEQLGAFTFVYTKICFILSLPILFIFSLSLFSGLIFS